MCSCMHANVYYSDYFTDIILPYLNNTVDSPIASQCPSTSSQSSGTGDVDINDLLDDVSHCSIIPTDTYCCPN